MWLKNTFYAVLLTASLVDQTYAQPVQDDADAAALGLDSEPSSPPPIENSKVKKKYFVEAAVGFVDQRHSGVPTALAHTSFDIRQTNSLAPGWRTTISDRLDVLYPKSFSGDTAVNSLREAYVGWQSNNGRTSWDAGRVNLHAGPSFGYNPTDFFRGGALRTLTTANPFTLRENQLGTVVLRGQQLIDKGAVSFAYAPSLADRPGQAGESLDLGSTNNGDKFQFALDRQFSESVSGQFLLYKPSSFSPQVGVNMTALAADSTVMHGEFTRSRETDLLERTANSSSSTSSHSRFSGGATYTTASKLSITGEYHYNGFAPDRNSWNRVRSTDASATGAFLSEARRLQDIASRRAYFLYVTQKNIGMVNLDLTILARINATDLSKLYWAELRYHFPRLDLALQVQQQTGSASTEYGSLPYGRSAQLLMAYYFQ